MKKNIFKLYIFPVLSIILLFIMWNMAGYLKHSYFVLPNILEKKLPFVVTPYKTGGEIIATYDDDIGDNFNYKLPYNEKYKSAENFIDIDRIKFRKPVDFLLTQYWAIDIEFNKYKINDINPNKFDLIKCSIYLDIDDGKDDGNNQPINTGEKIRFEAKFKWNYFISFNCLNNEGYMYSADTLKQYPVKIIFSPNFGMIQLRLPLVEKINAHMTSKYMGSFIAASGFYSNLDQSELLPVIFSGNGENDNQTPYFDFAIKDIIISKNNFVKLEPIKISEMKSKNYLELAEKTKNEIEKLASQYKSSFKLADNALEKTVYDLYINGKYAEAENNLIKLINSSSIANSIMAVITSKKAGEAKGTTKKIEYIDKAFDYFKDAEKLAKDRNDFFLLYTNRYNISLAVPDEVFGKTDQAISDLEKLVLSASSKEEKAVYYKKLLDIYINKNSSKEIKNILFEIDKLIK